jgi:hypothetical protein
MTKHTFAEAATAVEPQQRKAGEVVKEQSLGVHPKS